VLLCFGENICSPFGVLEEVLHACRYTPFLNDREKFVSTLLDIPFTLSFSFLLLPTMELLLPFPSLNFGSSFSFGESAPIQVALNNMVLTSTSVKQYNVDMAAAFIAGFPTLIVYILAGKYFIRGLTAGSVKG